jgi:hypothetical protein
MARFIFWPAAFSQCIEAVRRSRVCGVLLFAMAMPSIAFSQGDESSLIELELKLAESVEAIEIGRGPESVDLIEPLMELSAVLAQRGETASAVSVIERVRQIVRANYGPHSLRQAPLMRQLIAYEERRGDFRSAWILESELLNLAQRNADNLESAAILHEIADKRMALATQYLEGEAPPQIYFGCYYNWPQEYDVDGECNSGSRKDAIRSVVADAQRIYASAVAVILENEAYSTEELQQLETKIVQSNYWFRNIGLRQGVNAYNPYPMLSTKWRTRMNAVYELLDWQFPESYFESPLEQARPRQRDGGRGQWHLMGNQYYIGRLSLQRQLAYAIDTNAPLREQAEALVRIADWDLLAGQHGLAIEGYTLAHEKLWELGAQTGLFAAVFSPEVPVLLPALLRSPLSKAGVPTSDAYIDFQFELSRFGRARHVDLLGMSPESPETMKDAKAELMRLMKSARFRPQTQDGQFTSSTPVVARYYVDQASR